jgi:iron complex transport system substrate-binding protein
MRLNHRIALILMLLLLSCSRGVEREVASPRVISLVPSVTETIFALGAADHLLAVTTYCTHPEEARFIPKVGDLTSPSYERIVELDPDIVYLTLPLQRNILDDLTKLGIHCSDVSPESFDEIFSSIKGIARDLGLEKKGESFVEGLEDSLEWEIRERIDPPVSVYLELSDRPLYTVGRRSFINEVLVAAGGLNVFGDVDQAYFVTSSEELLNHPPEAIVLLYKSEEDLENRVGWSGIPAVEEGRVVRGLDLDLLSRPGPRVVDAIRALRTALNDVLNRRE